MVSGQKKQLSVMEGEKCGSKSSALNAMLLRAWRERWTDSQWGTNIKTVLPRGVSGDLYNLADSILQQAVLGSDANKLVLSYLRHSLCSRQVSYAAVLKRISKFDGFDRSYCLIALLDFLESVFNGIVCRSKSEENTLPTALLSIIYWFAQAFAAILEVYFINEIITLQQQQALNLLEKLMEKFVDSPFIIANLHVGKYEDPELFKKLNTKYVDVKNVLSKKKFAALSQAKCFENLLWQLAVPKKDNSPKFKTEPITYCLQPFIVVDVLLNPNSSTQTYVAQLLMIQQLKNYSWSRLYGELIRSALTSLYNVSRESEMNRESMWSTFTFIKVPYILKHLHSMNAADNENLDHSLDVVAALEMLIDDPMLDFLDTTCSCNTIEYLLNELAKHNLINAQHIQQFSSRRDSIMVSLSKMDLNNQPPSIIKQLKNAESVLSGILKTLDNDYNKMQEPLLGMLCELLSRNNFELFLSVATMEGKLKTFVSRLIRCNENSKQVSGEIDKPAMNRSALFDVSFLMLTFIVQTYGSDVVLDEHGDSFFETWVRDFMLEKNKNKSPMNMVHQCEQSKVDEFLMSMSSTDGGMVKTSSLKWQEICMNIPGVLYQLLVAWENETISAAEMKCHLDSIKSRQCSFSVCAASWLCSYMHIVRDDELLKPLNMVQQFLTVSTPDEMKQQNNFKERLNLTIQIIRKMQNDTHQSQKVRSIAQNVVSSHQPLEEQFHDVWKMISDRGWLPVKATQILDSLLQSCGPYWLVSKLVNEILFCKFTKDINKTMDIVFAIMHLNIESCTVTLLSDQLPMILLNKTQKFELIEPQLTAIARLCIYCIVSSLEIKLKSKKRSHSVGELSEIETRPAKMRKIDDPSIDPSIAGGMNNILIQKNISTDEPSKIRQPLKVCLQNLFQTFLQLTASDAMSPKIFFVYQFLSFLHLCGGNRITPVLSLLPNGLIKNLLKMMNVNDFSYDFVLKMYDLSTGSGRLGAIADLSLLHSIKMQNFNSIHF